MLKKTIRTILSFVVIVVLWQTACTLAHTNETLFPSPYKVLQAFIQLCTTGLPGSTSSVILPLHIETSLIRFAIGYFSSAVSAILLGLLLGSFPRVFTFINPILQIIRPIAPVAFMPFIVFHVIYNKMLNKNRTLYSLFRLDLMGRWTYNKKKFSNNRRHPPFTARKNR